MNEINITTSVNQFTIVDNGVTLSIINNQLPINISNQGAQINQLVITSNSIPLSIINNQLPINILNQGAQGIPGLGLPPGGLTGQVATKNSNINYDVSWRNPDESFTVTTAGQTISALKLVYTDPTTAKIFYADKDNTSTIYSLLGVTLQSGVINDTINVLSFGELVDSSWSWNMSGDVNLFLGANGAITQGISSGAVIAKIGYAISPTSIFMRIADIILTS